MKFKAFVVLAFLMAGVATFFTACSSTDAPTTPASVPTYPEGYQFMDTFNEAGWTTGGNYNIAGGSAYMSNPFLGSTDGTMSVSIVTSPVFSANQALQLQVDFTTTTDVAEVGVETNFGNTVNMTDIGAGTSPKLHFMVHSTAAVTITNVHIWDNAGNHWKRPGVNKAIAGDSAWHRTDVTVGAFGSPWVNTGGGALDWSQILAVFIDLGGPVTPFTVTYDDVYFTEN